MNDFSELARRVHRGDIQGAQKLLSEARHSSHSIREGIRAAERDVGRDSPLPDTTANSLEAIAAEQSAYPRQRRRHAPTKAGRKAA